MRMTTHYWSRLLYVLGLVLWQLYVATGATMDVFVLLSVGAHATATYGFARQLNVPAWPRRLGVVIVLLLVLVLSTILWLHMQLPPFPRVNPS